MLKKLFLFAIGILITHSILLPTHHIGQRFILSLPETSDRKSLQSWLCKTKPAGIMLLASHFGQRAKTKELISFLQHEAKNLGLPPLLVTIDWEGGIVSRPNQAGGFSSTPSPWALGNAGRPACFLAGMLIGSQLRSIGVNMNFAPSLDLYDSTNHILATRCFSADPERVAECGIAFAQGLMSQGVWPVIKHFPGLGLASGDTHLQSVGIATDSATFKKHMLPFDKALQAKIPCIMSTHATFPQFGKQPITLSKQAITYLTTRNEQALFITDDFSMKAVSPNNTPDDAVFKALQAGYHLIIFSGKADIQEALIARCQKKYALVSAAQQSVFEQQNAFIKKFKHSQQAPATKPLTPIHEKKLAHYLAQRCMQQQAPLPRISDAKITMITTNLPIIRPSEKWFIDQEKSYLHNKLEKSGISVDEIILNPKDSKSVNKLKEFLATYQDQAPLIIQTFFYADNVWNKIQREWLKELKPFQEKFIILSLGHPLEQTILPSAHIINVGSFHQPLLDIVAQQMCSKEALTGADRLATNLACWLKNKRFGILCHRCSTVNIFPNPTRILRQAQDERVSKCARPEPVEPFEQKNERCLLVDGGKQIFLPTILHSWANKQKDQTKLAAILCPEHGLFGTAEAFAHIKSCPTSEWGCPIYSLHGQYKKPTPEMLKNIDVLIIDLQDVGTRCFTYLSTLHLALEAAQENGIDVVVLDRPNPLACWKQDGPMLEKKFQSFVGKVYVPFLHGITIGSLAQKINDSIDCKLTVIECKDCDDDFFFTRPFIPPSPNLCSIDHIFAYPLTIFLEGINYSEGRGTPWPFLQFGAPWVDGKQLAQRLNVQNMPGVYFQPTHFVPQKIIGVAENPKHKDMLCQGIFVHVYDHESLQPMIVARTILETLFELYPQQSQWIKWGKQYGIDLLVGNDSWRQEIGVR